MRIVFWGLVAVAYLAFRSRPVEGQRPCQHIAVPRSCFRFGGEEQLMPITIYKTLIEFRGRTVAEYLVCGTPVGTPIRSLSGSVAAAIARSHGAEEAVAISEERFIALENLQDVTVIQVELQAIQEQREEGRLVFSLDRPDSRGNPGETAYIALSQGLLAMSSLHDNPERALGLRQGTWEPSPP